MIRIGCAVFNRTGGKNSTNDMMFSCVPVGIESIKAVVVK